jgi:UDPglucose--hexose-1-phosphate uridylyltransferase
MQNEIGQKFLRVLADAGVFKDDARGNAAFERFMGVCGFI